MMVEILAIALAVPAGILLAKLIEWAGNRWLP